MAIILPYRDKYPKIANDAFIAENAVIIGDVEIDSHANIWYNCLIRGDVNSIRIGEETNIQDGTVIHVHRNQGPTLIGKRVTVGHMALLHACEVEDEAFIGMGAKVIDYSRVESFAMVAAGALISPHKIVATKQLWAGIPAKYKRELSAEELGYIRESSSNYVELAQEYSSGFKQP